MTDFLLFLGKLNLAMGAAIIVAYLLRRPLRASFGAPVAYALWLLVPIAGLASLLPPRVAAPLPAHLTHLQNLAGQYPAAPMSVIRQIAHPALGITEQLTGPNALVHPLIAARAAASGFGTPDYALLLFAVWALGTVLMALYLARLQVRFHATMRLGEAGPAVLGFFRPRLVMPSTFQEQFTAAEQAAILAHEHVHLARQDARINALTALLRCLCWFNPLVHLGAAWLRIDQELACDATALAGPVSRRDYANALLKSQMMVTALPLGCNWPGSQHPLLERIALLKRKRPGTARRIAGTALVVFAATFAGLGAWAAQPPVPAGFITAPHNNNQIALATPMVMNPATGQNAEDPNKPVADVNPTGSGDTVDASKNVRVNKTISATPSEAPPGLLSKDAPTTAMASNEPPAAQSAPEASPAAAVALNDQPAMQPATPDPTAGPVQVAAATPASAGSDPVSAMKLLSNDGCRATVIGTVTSVHTDPQIFGTDIELDHAQQNVGIKNIFPSLTGRWRNDGVFTVFVPLRAAKKFSALNDYVGQKVIIWASAVSVGISEYAGTKSVFEIAAPNQVRLLSAALGLPCYLSKTQREQSSAETLQRTASAAPAKPASPAAAVTVNNQPVAPMQPATPDPSAAPVQVAAATPAGADPVSPIEALSANGCRPTIGTVISVHADPAHFDTDIVLDDILPSSANRAWRPDGTIIVLIPADNVESFPALNTYVGHKVVFWGTTRITAPRQLQLLSTALADPEKAWCHLSPVQREQMGAAAPAQFASEASLAAVVTVNNQSVAPMQPAAPDPAARLVQVAAATPAGVASDPVSPMEVLSSNSCHPIIGTAISVHSDPQLLGTDIVVDHVLPSHVVEGGPIGAFDSKRRGAVVVLIPTRDGKKFPALDTYVGQEVAIWDNGLQGFHEIGMPDQLQLLSTALADPKKTLCHRLGR